jgi:DNA-binding NarL/FixJ family response regulator
MPAETSTPMNVVLIEDETLVRHMLRKTIEKAGGLHVLAEFGDGKEGLDYCLRMKPPLVICDLNLPGMHGLEIIRVLREKQPETRILVLTSSTDGELPARFVALGVQGYVDKSEPLQYLVQAVRQVATGGLFFASKTKLKPARFLPGQASSPVGPPPVVPGAEPLSKRELEVARLVASGNSSKEVASQLNLSVRTVEKHRANIMAKIGVRDVASLTRYSIQHGLVTL